MAASRNVKVEEDMNLKIAFAICIVLAFALSSALLAQSNIDNSVPDKHAWGENIGWTNWRGEATPGQGVTVGPFVMEGYIWGENVGWISVGDGTPSVAPYYANVDGTDYGVNIDPDGDLHGFAWSENLGWINFDGGALAVPPQPARIECGDFGGGVSARLTGYVWSENAGWINLDDLTPTKFVALELDATPRACDLNQDGIDDGLDVHPFVTILLMGGASWQDICSGDVEATPDGTIDLDDVEPFVDCLLTKP